MADGTNWIDDLLGKRIQNSGVEIPDRKILNFGTGLLAVDDPAGGRTTVTATGGGGGGGSWADALAIGRDSGTNDPRISDSRHLDFQTEIDIRRAAVPWVAADSEQLIAVTGVRLTSVQNALGTATDIEAGAGSLGLRAINTTLATAGQLQYSPPLTFIGSGWFTDTVAPFQLLWGMRATPRNTTTSANDWGSLEFRRAKVGDGFGQVAARLDIQGGDPFFAILDGSAQAASVGRGLRGGANFELTLRNSFGGDDRIFEYAGSFGGADTSVFGFQSGGEFHIVEDLLGTPLPRILVGGGDYEVYDGTGIEPIAAWSADAHEFGGVDGNVFEGFFVNDPSLNGVGEGVTMAGKTGFGIQSNLPATAILDSFSRYMVWTAEIWDSNLSTNNPIAWGWQLRGDGHDHTATPDEWGRLALRAEHEGSEIDVAQWRFQSPNVDSVRNTFLEVPPTESTHFFHVKGADGLAGNDPGNLLFLWGGAAQGTGAGAPVVLTGGAAATDAAEGQVWATKHHDIDEGTAIADHTSLLIANPVQAATAILNQYSSILAWAGSAWDTDTAAADPTTWGAQLRTRSFDGATLVDYGSLVFSVTSLQGSADLLWITGQASATGVPSTIFVHRQADDAATVFYTGTDAIATDTNGGDGHQRRRRRFDWRRSDGNRARRSRYSWRRSVVRVRRSGRRAGDRSQCVAAIRRGAGH
jgi:hypothetical protein